MLEEIILGIVQGVCEWLPVSSEGLIVLIQTNFFSNGSASLYLSIQYALQLHIGTFLAALIYFRKDVLSIFKSCLNYPSASLEEKNLISYLFISTVISGLIGMALLKLFIQLNHTFFLSSELINGLIGALMLVTAALEFRAKKSGYRQLDNISLADSVWLGFVQGFSVLPGLSRSGLTVSLLLLRKVDKLTALKLSFLMSLPIVFLGNIVLELMNAKPLEISWISLSLSFVFGMATIHVLLKLAEKINFGYFVGAFGVLMIISVFV